MLRLPQPLSGFLVHHGSSPPSAAELDGASAGPAGPGADGWAAVVALPSGWLSARVSPLACSQQALE